MDRFRICGDGPEPYQPTARDWVIVCGAALLVIVVAFAIAWGMGL